MIFWDAPGWIVGGVQGHGLERLGSGVGPGEQFVDGAVEMPIDDAGQHVDEVGIGLHVVELAVLDQRGDDGPVVASAVGTGEQRILAIKSQRPD